MHKIHWDIARIRPHIAEHLPLAALLGIEVAAAVPEHSLVRLVANPHITRPGGSVAGPIMFAMADVAAYVLLLVLREEAGAATANLLINFFRPALELPLLAEAVLLRSGRRLMTFDVRIWPEGSPRDRLVAQATATFALPG
jgi:uncharacterized protein (TIGR00369 family)